MEVTIGGDRLGSGKKMQTNLRNFERSTHNLKEDFTSSIAPGVLYPFYCNVGLNGDTFNIDLNANCITLPTTGPLFGSFKLQLDMFVIPIRLYQAILHNNPIDIGLKMNQVKLPKMDIYAAKQLKDNVNNNDDLKQQINNTALLKYLGISGVGLKFDDLPDVPNTEVFLHRKFNAVPLLAYYDIFKCYYSNKQEKNAYVITSENNDFVSAYIEKMTEVYADNTSQIIDTRNKTEYVFKAYNISHGGVGDIYINENETNLIPEKVNIYLGGKINGQNTRKVKIGTLAQIKEEYQNLINTETAFGANIGDPTYYHIYPTEMAQNRGHIFTIDWSRAAGTYEDIKLKAFPLENIDKMRMDILSENQLGDEFVIKQDATQEDPREAYLPYLSVVQHLHDIQSDSNQTFTANEFPMNGLVVKTYQSDLFNNWIQTEWIDGENGINQITKINTTHGLQFDALVLQKKTWDMLNRIAISGGTYQDWQEAVYTEKAQRHAETPMWVGGYSDEIVFEQIVQTTPTEGDPLGTLGGRGKMIGTKHGGKIKIKITEPSIIMGIASITPRLSYSQGNAWYMTELDTLDDLHKPSLDGIGFQNLICEQMAWWDAQQLALNGNFARTSAGKVPAWINYMTAVDKVYGDFADNDPNDGKAFMTLARRYEVGEKGTIKDLTTYIDPQKFNYAFANASLTAQNFWLSIRSNVIARRKMSAKIIPNL